MGTECVLILDYGSQYTLLLARRARELGVRSEVRPWDTAARAIKELRPKGIVLSGGPASVRATGAPQLPAAILRSRIPVLGVCYGMQLLAQALGGSVRTGTRREYGIARLSVKRAGKLLSGVPRVSPVWASHGDDVEELPSGFVPLAMTSGDVLAAAEDPRRKLFMVQFHPEVVHTAYGTTVLRNFLSTACAVPGDWKPQNIFRELTTTIRRTVGSEHILCALSGGVDSTVVAALLQRAVPGQVHAVFVDHGLLRAGEAAEVEASLRPMLGSRLAVVTAQTRFLRALRGIRDPEQKRRIIGRLFIRVFEEQARLLGDIRFLAQGTLYPDVVESGAFGAGVTIKSHHNVGGLPRRMRFSVVEPLRDLFKDEVRAIGRLLGLPPALVERHPFPGPGLAIRILGTVTKEKLATVAAADAIFREELRRSSLHARVWQAFAVLLPVRTVGVMGDGRTYDRVVALRAVTSVDGMTADWANLPARFLARVSSRIVNTVPGISRVVYDISSKPPATVEWE